MKEFDEEQNLSEEERLHLENEIRKIKLSLEYGAVFPEIPDKKDLPPEIENEFLKYIETFESTHQNSERIILYDYIGKPDFIKEEELSDEDLVYELDHIMEILVLNGIDLDTICEVDDRTLYKFVTEELFLQQVNNVRIEGMHQCFIYEEFHPNHEHDIERHSTEFVKDFLNTDSDFYTTYITKNVESDKNLFYFRNSFREFTLSHFQITSLNYEGNKGKVNFNIDFTGIIEGSGELQQFNGEGYFDMVNEYDYWCVDKVQLPI
ncbi:MAG: hypothetical protein JXB49_19265 [Bacteroidales bacterium]|nr:hypothetical protein [Bacteroidales bacterium]